MHGESLGPTANMRQRRHYREDEFEGKYKYLMFIFKKLLHDRIIKDYLFFR